MAGRFIQRKEGADEQFPPLLELTVAGLLVTGLSIMIRIGWPLIPGLLNTGHLGLRDWVDQFIQRWPFVLLPFVCTLSIGVLCSYLGNKQWGWPRLAAVGGIINGLAFGAAAVLIVYLLDERFLTSNIHRSAETAEAIVVGTSVILGLVLGAIVVPTFSTSAQSTSVVRPSLPSQILLSDDPLTDFTTETVQSGPRGAIKDVGGYTRENATEIEGQYICFRPGFSNPALINAYNLAIRWDDRLACLVFEERDRADRMHSQYGQVFIPDGKPFISLVTIAKGAVRLITVSRPDDNGTARGVMLTFSNPKGVNFIPACAPIVLQRIGNQKLKVGLVTPEAPEYKDYFEQLNSVFPDFGVFALPATERIVVSESSALGERPTAH